MSTKKTKRGVDKNCGNLFNNHDNKLIFEFKNKRAANNFKRWLCDHSEQDYWMWMEDIEKQEEDDDITGIAFDYWTGTSYITVKCGRLDRSKP